MTLQERIEQLTTGRSGFTVADMVAAMAQRGRPVSYSWAGNVLFWLVRQGRLTRIASNGVYVYS